MKARSPDSSQRLAARIAGCTLLLLIASGLLSHFVFNAPILVPADPAATVHNLIAHQRTLRLSIAANIVMFNCDIVLAFALYALLKPVSATLAMLGALWRCANAIVLGASVASSIFIADLAKSTTFSVDQIQALIKVLSGLNGRSSTVCLIFFSLGAGLQSWLLLQTRYIPRILSALYLAVCAQMLVCCFVFLIFPALSSIVGWWFVLPDFFVELAVALWLAIKGADIPSPAYSLPSS